MTTEFAKDVHLVAKNVLMNHHVLNVKIIFLLNLINQDVRRSAQMRIALNALLLQEFSIIKSALSAKKDTILMKTLAPFKNMVDLIMIILSNA